MNKKGFTLIELITSVVLISLIIIPAFTIILNYKNKYQIASDKKELVKFQYLVTSRIEQDILQYGLSYLYWGEIPENKFLEKMSIYGDFDPNCFLKADGSGKIPNAEARKEARKGKKYTFTLLFSKDGSKRMTNTSYRVMTRYIEVDTVNKRITYYALNYKDNKRENEYVYELPVQYAEILDYNDVANSFYRTYIDYDLQELDSINNDTPYLSIFIPIKYVDDTNSDEMLDYGIHITAERIVDW